MRREQLPDSIGKRVRVTNPDGLNQWEGTLIALSDGPALMLALDNGDRVMLPRTFRVDDAADQAAYDAVNSYVAQVGDALPASVAERNALMWRAVQAALGAHSQNREAAS